MKWNRLAHVARLTRSDDGFVECSTEIEIVFGDSVENMCSDDE